MSEAGSPSSAAEQGLGYIFQPRFALLRILALPEDCVVYIERNDDVEFVAAGRPTGRTANSQARYDAGTREGVGSAPRPAASAIISKERSLVG
jgi:hypothetical protein